ncbi:MAG: hypothetical protein AAF389_18470 [Gemmatimonadota bacterium]
MTSIRSFALVLAVGAVALPRPASAQSGDMDALFGPATAVTQGRGMTDEIRAALSPGSEHQLLARLLGPWDVAGIAGRDSTQVRERAVFRSDFDGAWIIGEVEDDAGVRRRIHLGFDGYRRAFAMWEIGRGFTSPQVRVGAYSGESETLRLWRRYTIRVRETDSTVLEEVEIRFVGPDEIRWTSHETIADDPRRFQRDVTLTRRR